MVKIKALSTQEYFQNDLLPSQAHQIILGSLLGDMHYKKECLNSNIEESHAIDQKTYLVWKYSILKEHLDLCLGTLDSSICKTKEKDYLRKPQIRLRSRVSNKLNIYRDLFYQDGKKIINQKVLQQLDTLGLAIWYCDDGYYDPENHSVQIYTEGFSIEENHILKEWFKKKWDINVNFKKDPSKKKVLLRFSVKETDKFLSIISKHIFDMPKPIWYKLAHFWDGNMNRIYKARLNKSKRNKIYQNKEEIKIKRNQQTKKLYWKNREKILKEKAEYRKTKKYKDYIKEYYQRPEVKKRVSQRQKEYRQKPEYKKKARLYQKEYYKKLKEKQRGDKY